MVDQDMTRAQATAIGAVEIMLRGMGYGAHEARAFEELDRPPQLYNVDLNSCWIVYAKAEGFALRSGSRRVTKGVKTPVNFANAS